MNTGVHLRLLGMAVVWGGSWPAGRIVSLAMPPFAASAWRFLIAGTLLLVWLRWQRGSWPRLTARQIAALGAAGAVGVFGYATLFMLASKLVESGRGAVVVTTNPVFITVFAALLFRERFNALIALGLALAVIGAATVLTHGAPWKLLAGDIGRGEWLLLGCTATWTVYSLMGRRLMANIDSLTATTVTAVIGGAMLWVAALVVEGPAVTLDALLGLDAREVAALVFLAAGATALAYAWYYRGIEALGAGVASSYISLVPIFGVAGGALVLGETIDATLLVGGALTIAGVLLVNRARR